MTIKLIATEMTKEQWARDYIRKHGHTNCNGCGEVNLVLKRYYGLYLCPYCLNQARKNDDNR